MPFMRAGFNFRHRSTGIFAGTRRSGTRQSYAVAELIQFKPSGDYAWLDAAEKPRFLAWGDTCAFGTWEGITVRPEHQYGERHAIRQPVELAA